MSDLREAAQQALEALAFSCPAPRLMSKHTAAEAALRAALAQQVEPTVTEDMKSAVRWAPSSAYWSERLREFFGPDAREGIDALERRLAKAQQAEPAQDQRCRAEPRSDGDFVCDCKIGGCPGRSAEPAQQAEPTRSQQMAAAGFKPRDRRLECDECGGKFTAQMLPIHKCAQQAEPVLVVEKEPDYWSGGHFHQGSKPHIDPTKVWSLPIGTKLYTAPPRRTMVPLTEEEIKACLRIPAGRDALTRLEFARAIEAKLKEKNNGQA